MSLIFAAVAPHPPILIPTIGKDNLDKIEKTSAALAELEKFLYHLQPDILIIISPHGQITPEAFTINLAEEFEINFQHFGDFATKLEAKGEMILLSANKEKLSAKSPINIISQPELDHGVGVPFWALARNLKETKLIPITFSLLDSQAQLEFGKSLKEIIVGSDKRIAVVASGDLSHCLTENAPAGFNPSGKEFDEKLINLLKNRDTQGVVNLDAELIDRAAECGRRSILILLGVLNNVNFNPQILSYEAPFGVGYLVANFQLE
jgi:aromatic ring-opening dioxygenase LigB subunit